MANQKNAKPVLHMFTTSYPYDYAKENTFIESEIDYIARNFHITLVPKYLQGDIYPSCPDILEIDTSFAKEYERKFRINKNKNFYMLQYLKYFRFLLNFLFWKELFRTVIIKPSKESIYHVLYFAASRSAARSWFKKKYFKVNRSNSLIYGWWLTPEILAIAATRRRCKVVSRAHGGDLYAWRQSPNYFPFRKNDIKKIDSIFSCSNNGKKYLEENYPLARKHISVSYLGVPDFGINSKVNESKNFMVIVSCSFLDPIKQLDILINGLDLFSCSNPHVNLTWYHIGNGILKKELQAQAQEKNSFKSIFIPYVNRKELMNFYLNNYITSFINSSASEGLPVSMMEAASCGLPLMGPKVGGIDEIIIDNKNGYLLSETLTIKNLAEGLARLHSLEMKELNNFRKNSRLIWSKNFHAEYTYTDFTNKLMNILKT